MNIKEQLLRLTADGNKAFAQSLQPGVPNVLGIRVPQLRGLALFATSSSRVRRMLSSSKATSILSPTTR